MKNYNLKVGDTVYYDVFNNKNPKWEVKTIIRENSHSDISTFDKVLIEQERKHWLTGKTYIKQDWVYASSVWLSIDEQ